MSIGTFISLIMGLPGQHAGVLTVFPMINGGAAWADTDSEHSCRRPIRATPTTPGAIPAPP
jgi:hypothetical protein